MFPARGSKRWKGWDASSVEEVLKPRASKYNNTKTEVDGILFHSKREAVHYQELNWRYKAGEITKPELQPRFKLIVNDKLICTYVADFFYTVIATGERIADDTKGYKTAIYKLKKKLFEALYPDIKLIES